MSHVALVSAAAAASLPADSAGNCVVESPTVGDASWWELCYDRERNFMARGGFYDPRQCCVKHPCGRACKEGEPPPCYEAPPQLVKRSFKVGKQAGALEKLRQRILCSRANRSLLTLTVAVVGGSVTAGPKGQSWAKFMMERVSMWTPVSTTGTTASSNNVTHTSILWNKLSANGMGPDYLSSCWERHKERWGGTASPDVVFLEYAVNDMMNADTVDMESLVRVLLGRGTIVVLFHHFTPAFMVGGMGYKQHVFATAEAKHARIATHYGLSTVSVGEATGLSNLSTAWQRASARNATGHRTRGAPMAASRYHAADAMLHPCTFQCAFGDPIHPTVCGQRMLGQFGAYALQRLLLLDRHIKARPADGTSSVLQGRCSAAAQSAPHSTSCVALPSPMSWVAQETTECEDGGSKCWSNVGDVSEWNLRPTRMRNFRLVDLKSTGRGAPGKVVKMMWEGRGVGSFGEFEINCSSAVYQAVRVMYLTGDGTHFSHASISIDGAVVGKPSGFRRNGNLFTHADYRFPTRCGRGGAFLQARRPCPRVHHFVRVTVLNETDVPSTRKIFNKIKSFGVNAFMCVRLPGSAMAH